MVIPTLPDEFAWRPHAGSEALTFRGKIAGLVSPLADGRAMTSRCVGTASLAHTFHSSPEVSAQFLNAWAIKWHREIEDLYDGLATGEPPAGKAAGGPVAPELHVPHRKTRKRR